MPTTRRALFLTGAATLAAPAILRSTAARAEAAPKGTPGPRYLRRKLGAFEITALLDGTIQAAPDLIPAYDADKAAAALRRQHMSPAQGQSLPVIGHLINTGERLIAIDTGTFKGFAPDVGGYHAALAQAGHSPDDVDAILLTHLHPDHFGGMSDGEGSARFSNAEVLISATEWNFWHNADVYASVTDADRVFFDLARGYTAPYDDRIHTFDGEPEVLPGIQAIALPGHTPGHTGYRISSEGQDLLIWGDVIHATGLQFAHPDWTMVYDMDPDQTRKTRAQILDMAATENLMVAGSHLDFPGFGFVEKSDGYRFVPAPFDYML